ncbi:HNH endonuclease [Polaromonas sp. LjRoot131]|uniref:HNH endonuclease n=1 Tax=Polaromonas sp. LjRoot131 TaxID=3342262 RepID=UPI003ED06ACD
MNRKKQLCLLAAAQQNWQCFYCGLPMCKGAVKPFAAKHGISVAEATQLRSTAEHLLAAQDGGQVTPGNIVAACAWCNSRRHAGRPHKAPDHLTYKCRVAKRVAAGKWHPGGLAAKFRRQ